jgi:hypothetical protein
MPRGPQIEGHLPPSCRPVRTRGAIGVGWAAVAAVAALACGARPLDVPLAQLVAHAPTYEGRSVRTEGVVRAFTDQRDTYWVLEDENANRVGLRPDQGAGAFVGKGVRVVGQYGFDAGVGRFIRPTRITALGSAEGS